MKQKKINCIFYLVDDYIFLYNNEKKYLKKYQFTNYLFEGRIIKPKIIIKKLNDILKKEKIIKLFSIQNTVVIYNPNLKYIDKKIIIDVFNECNFKSIKLINSADILKKSKSYLEINNSYIIFYQNNKYIYFKLNELLNVENIIKMIIRKTENNIIVVGINNKINMLCNSIKRLYYIENSNTYFIDKIAKKK